MLRYYLRRKLHVSWIIAITSTALFVGVVLAHAIAPGTFSSIAWLLAGILLLVATAVYRRMWVVSLAIIAGLCIGLWRGSVHADDLAVYRQLYGKTAELSGTVAEDIDTNKRGQLVLRLKDITVAGHSLKGLMWVTVRAPNATIQRSDRVTVRGKISEGFGTFAASIYTASLLDIARPQPGDIALSVRNWFAGGVDKATNEPQTSLGLGYLVGQRRGLPEELDTALRTAGLTHIVVASGYNLTILVRLSRRLFEKVSKYLSLLASSSMILGFIAVTGMSPSMSRAGLVAGLSLLAWYYGRRFHPLVLLPLVVAITVLVNPSYAWGDLGWQLSFAAFAGVMIVAPLANAYFFGDKPERPLGRILIETLAAQLCTLPIILLTFGQLSIVAPIANLLILPFVPLAMLLTFIAGIGGLLVPGLAHIVGLPAELLLSYMTQTIMYVGKLPWATREVALSAVGAVLFYALIIGLAVYMQRKTKLNLGHTSLVE